MESLVLNNRYRLLERVGSGGMAVVYGGVDTLLERRVAVKILQERFASDPAFLARFQREARAAANLDHPNVVTVYDVGQDGGRHYIVMEYVDGQDLKTLIRQKGRLSVDKTLDIAVEVCAGVGHAHEAGVVHCDIKPQNVLVTQDGRAKVTDFGIARALSESGLTETETVWGSPLYLSPEQAAGELPSPASDVYSIGVMMYEMLAGSPPFQAEKPAALALMHMREEPSPLAVCNSQVPPRLEWIVRKVLAKEPSARYRTASQLARVLKEYCRQGEEATGWQPAVPRSKPSTLSAPDYVSEAEARPVPQTASDGLTWMLAAIAFVAVVGLIPLWWLVYRSYSALPSLPATATGQPLVTQKAEAQSVAVPDVVDRPVDEARRMLNREGLGLVLVEERDQPGSERGVVLEQSAPPNALVAAGSQISVVVSGPARELTMPGVVGYRVEMVEEGLESDGLVVRLEEVWDTGQEGVVLAQEPERGTTVYAGDAVTLTVSGGVDMPIPLEVNLADLIVLESAELRQETFQAGGTIALTLRWHALRSIDTHYTVFVHLIAPDGRLVAQQDVEPSMPTAMWVPGVEVVDAHQFAIPAAQSGGRHQLRTGMYPQGRPSARVPVADAGLTTAESNSILIAEIEVQP